ncbi:MAG: hypothetical protein Q9168_002933 [Polycauliona sp. 1 TL-2023]
MSSLGRITHVDIPEVKVTKPNKKGKEVDITGVYGPPEDKRLAMETEAEENAFKRFYVDGGLDDLRKEHESDDERFKDHYHTPGGKWSDSEIRKEELKVFKDEYEKLYRAYCEKEYKEDDGERFTAYTEAE